MNREKKKRKKWQLSRSFLLRFLASYLIVLLIPVITILFTYKTAEKAIREEVLKSNEASLFQLFDLFDVRLTDMFSTILQTGADSSVQESIGSDYVSGHMSDYQGYQVFQRLKTLIRSDYNDVFIYYKNAGIITSGAFSRLDIESYYNTYYRCDWLDYSQWKAQLDATSIKKVRLLYTAEGKPTLSLFQSAPINHLGGINATVVAVFKPERIAAFLKGTAIHDGGGVLLFDGEDKLLLASDAKFNQVNLNAYNGEERFYSDTFGGEDYVVQLYPSGVADMTYVSVIPESTFWEKLHRLRFLYTLSILGCMTVSVLLAVELARRSYMPFSRLISQVSARTNLHYNRKEYNEAEFISTALTELSEEREMLKGELKRRSDSIREKFLLKVLQGIVPDPDNWKKAFAENGISPVADYFSVLLFEIESWDPRLTGDDEKEGSQEMLNFIMFNVLEELFAQDGQGYVLQLKKNLFASIVGASEDKSTEKLTERSETARLFLKKHMAVCCSIGMGRIHEGQNGIHLSYTDALSALDYRFVFGRCRTIGFDDIRGRSFSYCYSFCESAEQQLRLFIQSEGAAGKNGTEMAEEILRGFIPAQTASLEALRSFRYDTVNLMNRIITSLRLVPMEKENSMVETLLSADTLEDFKKSLGFILDELKSIKESHQEQNEAGVKIRDYIDRHFANPDLNINHIGEFMCLSPSYASKLFKNQFGISPADYLARVRLDCAKRLLTQSDKGIEDISRTVGFLSSSVFIRTFKRTEGITPGIFRKVNPGWREEP